MDKYQCLKLISCQVFSPNCQKITWRYHGGCLMPPTRPVMGVLQGESDTPMLFFSKNKNYLSNQMHSLFSKNKSNMGDIMSPSMMILIMGGIRGHQTLPTLHPSPTTSLTSTPHTPPTPPTTPSPPPRHHPHPTTHPWRKSGALLPDMSWAPPHSLPIR